MTSMDQFKETFFQECEERLALLEQHIGELARSTDPTESINAAFRALHSIKGGAGMFSFTRIAAFAHAIENVLDTLRSGAIPASPDLVSKLLTAGDVLTDLANAERCGGEIAIGYEAAVSDELASCTAGLERRDRIAGEPRAGQPAKARSRFRIAFEPTPDVLRRGVEPLLLARNLAALGTLASHIDISRLPPLESLDPTDCHGSWVFELETEAPVEVVAAVFEFVSAECRVEIVPLIEDAEPQGKTDPRPSREQTPRSPASAPRRDSIRVDLDRVERLVDLVAEVTTAQSVILQHLERSSIESNASVYKSVSLLLQLSRNLQEGVMAIRAQPIRSIVSRLQRAVREAAQETGKRVELHATGEDTEIDKTIIEQLSDPLIHIVRNCIDHGIEDADTRRQAGKPESGQLKLSAMQRGGRIIVEISDDGRGIDRKRVRQRAIELGLIKADADIDGPDIDSLIFSPGLSTAGRISALSGRGVGMDVVLRDIQRIGGRIFIRSEAGAGTTVTITLPLTLAVLDAMMVRVGGQYHFIPMSNVVTCQVVNRGEIRRVAGSGSFISHKGRQIRVHSLAEQLGMRASEESLRLQVLILEGETGAVVGLIVDEICSHRQIVVKSINQSFATPAGLSGVTILGDGRVAFIIDISQLVRLAPVDGSDHPIEPRRSDPAEAIAL